MYTFVDCYRKVHQAYGEMPCIDQDEHKPHSFHGEFTMYGPYMCWGIPYQGPKHRKGNFNG